MLNIGPVEFLLILAILALPIWAVLDAAVRSDRTWAAIGQSKIVWVVVPLFLPIVGALAYLLLIRPKFRRVAGT